MALVVISCTDETSEQGIGKGDGIFRLSSDKGVFTRATGGERTFGEETVYQIYAIVGTDFSANYLRDQAITDASLKGTPLVGTESDNATIELDDTQGPINNKFGGRTLNFYAVTDSTTIPVAVNSANDPPTCSIAYPNNPLIELPKLPNLMWAMKENQDYKNSGVIKLPFKHTLAKLNLYVMKSSDYAGDKVVLNEISLTDYPSGDLNMLTGKYNPSASSDRRNRDVTVYSSGVQVVETSAKSVLLDPANLESQISPLIFPTRKENIDEVDRIDHSMWVTVKGIINEGTPGEQEIDKDIEITSTLAEGTGDATTTKVLPFIFESNHEYDLVITITNGSLIVTIVPRLYEWIPDETDLADNEVKSSMTIGGITWMDRNLGATSGDPMASDQAWENSRGYYYQFGRNIPFYIPRKIDPNNIDPITNKNIEYAPSHEDWHLSESMPYPFIPGKKLEDGATAAAPVFLVYNYDSWKVQTGWDENTGNTDVAQYPTEISKQFNFFFYNGNNVCWDFNPYLDTNFYTKASYFNYSKRNWLTNANHPCPKGWRIPTREEFQLVIPTTEDAGDIPFRRADRLGKETYIVTTTGDPEVGSTSVYVGVNAEVVDWAETEVGVTNSIYALKRMGTDNAYFLRWHIERVNGGREIPNENITVSPNDKADPYRNVLVISRYPATSSSTLHNDATSADVKGYVRNAAEWAHPVEQIKLPLSGYIHTGDEGKNGSNTKRPALIYSGAEAVYWTSTCTSGVDGYHSVRMKFSGNDEDKQIKMFGSENRANGCMIRCVRDTKAD